MFLNQKKFLAVIPARSGSKGIPNKNIRDFCGKPLVAYAIQEAQKSKYLDRIIVSTDSPKYADIAKKYCAEVPFLRPKNLAGDKSLIADAVHDLLKKLELKENYKPDYVVLLQTTSPMRTIEDINKCVKVALETNCDGVMTICPTENLLYAINDNGYLNLLYSKKWLVNTNRQSAPATYKINGPAVVISKVSSFLKTKSFLKGRVAAVIMEKWKSVDLDTEEDFLLAELIYKNRKLFDKNKGEKDE